MITHLGLTPHPCTPSLCGRARQRLWLMIVLFLLALPVAARAEIRVAIGTIITADKNTSPRDAEILESALRSALAEEVQKVADAGECDITNMDLDRRLLEGRKTEQRLMDEGYSPKNGIKIGKIIVSDMIHGVVGFDGDGGFDYVLESENLVSGKKVARVEGNTKESRLDEAATRVAREFVEQLCRHKPFRLQATYNDLVIDTLICDPTKPFHFNGKGATSGLTFSLTPEGDAGGAWTVAGKAGGVVWSGGGAYAQELGPDSGTLDLSGSWQIKTPRGTFGESGTIKGKVTKLATTQCAGE